MNQKPTKSERNILWFEEIGKEDLSLAGGKGANLGELTRLKVPVPPGFCVAAKAYFDFLEHGSLRQKVAHLLRGIKVNNPRALKEASQQIQAAILASSLSAALLKEIRSAYQRLCGTHDVPVAVRSSATAEDLPEASFAGQQETYLNVLGAKAVGEAVQKCWASLFTPRAIFYRKEKGFDHFQVGISAVVQVMVEAEVSGVMFTVDPLTQNRKHLAIEAAFGLGQPVVSGELTPDQYLIDKENLTILDKKILTQTWKLTGKGKKPVANFAQKRQKLSDEFILKLARWGKRVEEHYFWPQDIEWVLDGSQLSLVQTRPVTTLKIKPPSATAFTFSQPLGEHLLLSGLGASPGVVSGKVRLIPTPTEIEKIRKGEILVTKMTNPDFVPVMKKAAAVVTDEGGRTSHAAIVSREMGLPCVVGTELATKILKNGEIVTVDGFAGKIYAGQILNLSGQDETEEGISLVTATKLYVNLAEPENAEKVARKSVDGVGLLRAEFMIAQMGKHPRAYLDEGRRQEFISKLAEGLKIIAQAFHPRPVIYRTSDLKTSEYRHLKGGEKYEKEELNPLLGYRGALRYLQDTESFKMELEAVRRVRQHHRLRNLHLMLPFVRTPEEFRQVKLLLAAAGLTRSPTFKIYLMVEIPANIILLEKFAALGLDGISLGSNDLTMLTLGADRDNPLLSKSYNEMDGAVLSLMEMAVKKAKKLNLKTSICGQAPSVYPELIEKLVGWGISSISVNPDAIGKVRRLIADAEKKNVQN